MQTNVFKKYYIALVDGILNKKSGIVDVPIARKENSIIERCVDDNGAYAITEYSVIKEFNNMSLVYLHLQTGRTHQIRVHMTYIGHPIVGDSLYGTKSTLINRQALHACKVSFIHPISKKNVNCEAAFPQDMELILQCHKMS